LEGGNGVSGADGGKVEKRDEVAENERVAAGRREGARRTSSMSVKRVKWRE